MCPDTDTTSGDSAHVVTAFLRHRSDVLCLRRSDAVGTYRGQWGGVSGFAEGNPDDQVRTEIREETGLEPGETISFVRSGRPVEFEDADLEREWVVHPYLFDCNTREVELSEEHDAAEWVPPTAIFEDDRETVPKLWTAYERVAPTVRSIAADDEHGAAALSLRALEVLRDRAGLLVAERAASSEGTESPRANGEPVSEATSSPRNGERDTRESGPQPADEWDELAELAGRLLEARPSMAVLRNRVNRAMAGAAGADGDRRDASAVLESALSTIDRTLAADTETAAIAADRLGGSVATLSRSGTVLEALETGEPSRIFVAESRPAREGIDVAERLAATTDCTVTVHTDAAVAAVLARDDVDRVVVGADTVLPDGSVVNKTGTRTLAVAAAREGVPVSVVAATAKVSTSEAVNLESGDRSAVYDGDAAIDALNPTFDVTPADCVTEIVTERGVLEPAEIDAVADELRDLEAW
ncbi:initiation factor 2B related protein [Natrinema pellirubrum DSM 15624]|uniref:Initiation factor 2B related protein n=1 Tax=Natrinema pellirubrum (strain DSM 15624 / CIP 106293 / JCM 10476 / NCIMB 786 / 157) TaxID=797303 RepID=L0JH57_NATP1|nr:NUDIX domain-containing protein [Natrinema pellirubrum]AGB30193.1 translation initiation factor 2B subunit, eIF-2B alpha/beta/delta family [Natrinema pellirubrum DSM 15624]ELY78480.1 initiation factor 2B related protein [Natrinema pellirubrum DSM 15624]